MASGVFDRLKHASVSSRGPCSKTRELDSRTVVQPCTGRMGWMAHRKWKETKQPPGTAGPGNMLGWCLVSFHFLRAIHPIRLVHVFDHATVPAPTTDRRVEWHLTWYTTRAHGHMSQIWSTPLHVQTSFSSVKMHTGGPVRSATTFCCLCFGSSGVCPSMLWLPQQLAATNMAELAWHLGNMVEF